MKRLAGALFGLMLVAGGAAAATHDGRWQLVIDGHNTYLFGEPQLGGGLRLPWRVEIDFQVRDGSYHVGSGSARLAGEALPLSYPAGWFDCRQVAGTYLDSSLSLHETPRVRFARFPVAGRVDGGRLQLQPGYEPPGNYLAVTYECQADGVMSREWFALAERGKQVMGKRQDAERNSDGAVQRVRVREVVALPPEAALELPLLDGWQFSLGTPGDASRVSYTLHRQSD